MAETEKKGNSGKRITEEQRLHYIGFDVYPGKPKDLFKNDAERQKLVDQVVARREKGDTLRDHNTLMETRVSMGERVLLTIASLAILAALFLPWYSAYMEVPIEAPAPTAPQYSYEILSVDGPSAMVVTPHRDSTALWAVAQEIILAPQAEDAVPISDISFLTDAPMPDTDPQAEGLIYAAFSRSADGQEALGLTAEGAVWPVEEQSTYAAAGGMDVQSHEGEGANEEILTGHVKARRFTKEYSYLSGIGVFGAFGSVGGKVFSSGIVVILSAVLMLVNGLLCIVLPVVNLYGLYGIKGKPDDAALKLKRILRLNWLPLVLTTVVVVLAFFGASYGFDTEGGYASIGTQYSIGVLFNSLSWGLFVAIAASLIAAFKAVEI